MKCLVFSDSHGSTYNMRRAIELNRDAEVIFFLGDGLSDIHTIKNEYPDKAVIAVRGNCDFTSRFMGEDLKKVESITLMGKKIVLTHGDLYGAKGGVGGLISLARDEDADILLFGHTHTPCEMYVSEYSAPFYLFNPGSIGNFTASFGVITLYEGRAPLLSHGSLT